MAKRKRLTPANPAVFGAAPTAGVSRAPIADVAADASATAALDQISHELSQARAAGRMVLSLTLDQIQLDHLVRDRIHAADADMQTLIRSISTRGQQTPIEVMELPSGKYGLISGWRRCRAIAQLAEDNAHDGQVLALLRQPADASDAYLAMVEENEIRVGLSYFERARIAAKSVKQGVFETEKAALLSLFQSASRPKRSKIRSFLPLVAAFDDVLRYPHLIGERLGLRMAATLQADPAFAATLEAALRHPAPSSEAEHAVIEQVLKARAATSKTESNKPKMGAERLGKDLTARWQEDGDLVLSGAGLTPKLREQILDFVKEMSKKK